MGMSVSIFGSLTKPFSRDNKNTAKGSELGALSYVVDYKKCGDLPLLGTTVLSNLRV